MSKIICYSKLCCCSPVEVSLGNIPSFPQAEPLMNDCIRARFPVLMSRWWHQSKNMCVNRWEVRHSDRKRGPYVNASPFTIPHSLADARFIGSIPASPSLWLLFASECVIRCFWGALLLEIAESRSENIAIKGCGNTGRRQLNRAETRYKAI